MAIGGARRGPAAGIPARSRARGELPLRPSRRLKGLNVTIDRIDALHHAPALRALSGQPARTGVDPVLASKFAALLEARPQAPAAEDDPDGEARPMPGHLFLGQLRA